MTYKEAVSLFKVRYRRSAEKQTYQLEDGEIIMELSAVQSDLQNRFYLSTKLSSENATAQTTLSAGVAIYTSGTGASNIPNDIIQVIAVYLNDNMQSKLKMVSPSMLRDMMKITGKPLYYMMSKQNNSLSLELDTYPDSTYTLTMLYVPRYDIYAGSAGTNTTNWSDLDYSANGFGGSLKLPAEWDFLIVEGALANALGDSKLQDEWWKKVYDTASRRAYHFGGDIPFNDGTTIGYRILEPGQDYPRR